ncbi:MAG: thiamine phosphate synthase [Candidatus Delongbacteria bacterium]|nr:thiamine phosphate synthase [Candidatus Delongbacteria bacterium]MBN2836488.1 thiamine phosphate synthase [Candidatus Delongbacteria bacterium]
MKGNLKKTGKLLTYAITPDFEKKTISCLKKIKCDFLQLRNRNFEISSKLNLDDLEFSKNKTKLIINYHNLKDIIDFNFSKIDGVHYQRDTLKFRDYVKAFDFLSCHCEEDLILAESKGFMYVTISPIFPTKSHPECNKFIDPSKLKIWCKRYRSLKIFVLGGISKDNLLKIDAEYSGYAGISLFF